MSINRIVMQEFNGKMIPRRLPRTIDDIREWFWTHVDKMPNGCWEWQGPRLKPPCNYGQCRVDNKKQAAHRVAYILAYGEIPKGWLVCHGCDNPPCVNPDHLFLGTDQVNHRDAVNKGRKWDCRGEASFNAKFTKEMILEIRRRYDSGVGCRQIGRELGVSHTTISCIGLRKTWRHI